MPASASDECLVTSIAARQGWLVEPYPGPVRGWDERERSLSLRAHVPQATGIRMRGLVSSCNSRQHGPQLCFSSSSICAVFVGQIGFGIFQCAQLPRTPCQCLLQPVAIGAAGTAVTINDINDILMIVRSTGAIIVISEAAQ